MFEMPQLKILSIVENEDGSASIDFDISDEFQSWFVKFYNLSEWSEEAFRTWALDGLKTGLEIMKVDKSQDPDFLWDTPPNV